MIANTITPNKYSMYFLRIFPLSLFSMRLPILPYATARCSGFSLIGICTSAETILKPIAIYQTKS